MSTSALSLPLASALPLAPFSTHPPQRQTRPYSNAHTRGQHPSNAVDLCDVNTQAPYPYNPVSIKHLIRYTLDAIDQPVDGEKTRIILHRKGAQNQPIPFKGEVRSQSATGSVVIQGDDGTTITTDLDQEEYEWE